MHQVRNYILSIAGFDPSSGAGVTADIKTFEAHKTYGLGVITANTIQTDSRFERCIWVDKKIILEQIDVLLSCYKVKVIKIGIVENRKILLEIIDFILSKNEKIKIIWDPVLKSETGFIFSDQENEFLDDILSKIYLFVPNYDEVKLISKNRDLDTFLNEKAKITNIFLKGGHRDDNKKYYDYLYTLSGKKYSFRPKKISKYTKHGSGCILSSAITANLSLGYKLLKACLKSKDYVTYVLNSNKTKLGFHKYKTN